MGWYDVQLNYGRNIILEWTENAVCDVVLDLGAAKGDDLDNIKLNHPKIKSYAIENWASNIAILEEKGHIVYDLDIEKDSLPFHDETVDIIVLNQILEHTKNIFWIFHECTRVLKRSGRVIVGVPNLAALHSRILLLAGCQPSCIRTNSAHIRGYTYGGFLSLVEIFDGYELNKFTGSNFYPFSPGLAKFFSKQFPTLAVCIFFELIKKNKYADEYIKYPSDNRLATNFYLG